MDVEQPKRVEANGIEFAYLDSGDGPTVLVLHGFPDLATSFLPVTDRLVAAGYRCVAPWLRGYWPTGTGRFYDEGTLIADTIALVERLGLAPVRVIGHDWGADLAYGTSCARPDLVASSVALAIPHERALRANGRTDYEQIRRFFYMWMFCVGELAEVAVPADGFAFVQRLWRDWSPGWEPPEQHLGAVIETLARPGVLAAALDYYRALFDPAKQDPDRADLRRAVGGEIGVPTLLLMGERDGCVAPDMARGAEAAFRGPYRFEVLKGCGHFLHLERPEEVAGRVLAWFGEHG